ncbi:ATP-binding protein [Pseudoramibacter sp.]|uniref:ATP-binding protein n=1 Tax=Pseudoramibacter sp. TaxID=2034862 RepID=UPI0025F04F2E|nr:ATP-binding protein [Pseudoramibacter sp.]MCH4071853.1 ATP-binding protein [Pseudoramibacter sp.]MCH4105622.1 ATP-binding protein [Pseudoramibacter sp.]
MGQRIPEKEIANFLFADAKQREEKAMTRYVSSTPQASLLLHSLRSVGYSEEAAVADIVDNAIAADANEIHINFDWENREFAEITWKNCIMK